MMLQFRVTKYDPSSRNADGGYAGCEWTSISDVGSCFNGKTLTREEYERVELSYIRTALSFLKEAGIASMEISGLECDEAAEVSIHEGDVVSLERIGKILSQALREELWLRLEGRESFIHVGYDFYMYIGVPDRCPEAERLARMLGLFVDPFDSPYVNQEAS